ncbi:MAG: cysteine hydrolase [Pseudomonadota bacterium]|uniref:cysteine hydrolase family protein n=1 Tax=Sphingomonas sp. ERG5 TaxID=1381597 RepID=UPI00054B4F86|nr:cysteine hydrolase [Sphingomonas sp. ERG5]
MKQFNGLAIPMSLGDLLDPTQLALIIYDVQVGICSQISGGGQVVAACTKVLEAARAAGVRTIFTRHLSLPKALMGSTAYRTAMAWQRTDDPAAVKPWFLRGTPGFEIMSELAPNENEAVFDKITMSAFEGTPLHITLRDCGVKAVAFCGIAMEIGIDPSLRHAADLGFVPILIEDACGHGNAEAAARSVAALRFNGDTVITDVAAFVAGLG